MKQTNALQHRMLWGVLEMFKVILRFVSNES